MLVHGLRIRSIVQWEAVPSADGAGHFQSENFAIYMDKPIKGDQVCEALEKIKAARGMPQ